MYLPAVAYDAAVAFVQGYDAAGLGGLLAAFREWLIVKVDHGNSLSWPALVTELMRRAMPVNELKSPDDHKAAIEFLFATLEQFLSDRDMPGGTRRIYVAYQCWLRRQEWYGPSSPDWIPEDST